MGLCRCDKKKITLSLKKKFWFQFIILRVAARRKEIIWIWIEVPLLSLSSRLKLFMIFFSTIWSFCFSWDFAEQKIGEKNRQFLNIILKSRDVREQITWHLAVVAAFFFDDSNMHKCQLGILQQHFQMLQVAPSSLTVKFNKFSFAAS